MKSAFALSILLFLIAATFGLSSEEENAKTAHIVFRYIESMAVAFFWFEITVRALGYWHLRREEKIEETRKEDVSHGKGPAEVDVEKKKANKRERKRSKRLWVWIDLVLTIIVSFPASSIYPISTLCRAGLSTVYKWGSFMYVLQALAVFKLYTVHPGLRAAGRHLTTNPSKYFKETAITLAAGVLILLSGCFVYELLLIYYLDDYINSSVTVENRHLWSSLKMAFSTMVRMLTRDDWYSLYEDIGKVRTGGWQWITCLLVVGWVWIGGLVFAYLGHAAMVQYLMGVQPASQVIRSQTREVDVLKSRLATVKEDTESYYRAFKDLLEDNEEKADISWNEDRAKITEMVDRQEQLYDMMDTCIHRLIHHKMSVPPRIVVDGSSNNGS